MSGAPEPEAAAPEEPEVVWAIVELMGHVRYGGRLSEEQHFGTTMGRVDVPDDGDGFTTVFFGGSSVYRITPCSEDVARKVASFGRPRPVSRFELEQADDDYDDDGEPF